MPVTAGARRPVLVLAVWTMEKIGAQCRCTTGSKLPEHPQLVGAPVKQGEQNGESRAQGAVPGSLVVDSLGAALHRWTERLHVSPPEADWLAVSPVCALTVRCSRC